MKKVLKIILFLIIIFAIGFGILFVFDKVFGTNSFADIQSSISQLFATKQPEEQKPTDNTPLVVELQTESQTILEPTTAVTVTSNKEISIEENAKTSLVLVKTTTATDNTPKYWYALEIKNIGVGEATVNTTVKDQSGNTQKLIVSLNRQGYSLPFGLKSIDPWPNSTYTADGDDFKAQVNKEHKLINDYAPTDLKNLNSDYLLYTNTASITLRKEPADYLSMMVKDLQKATGKNLVIASGYRSYEEQYRIYTGYVRDMGQKATDKVSARPGFSEHQLGTAVDFIDQQSGLELTAKFATTVAGKWVIANSYKYGFVPSYPKGKEEKTGYSYEAWHYRFIGIDNATAMHESGLTLKEWLEQNP